MVQLVNDHIEECKLLDRKRFGSSAYTSSARKSEITELPDIDDAGFQQLKQNDQEIVCKYLFLYRYHCWY